MVSTLQLTVDGMGPPIGHTTLYNHQRAHSSHFSETSHRLHFADGANERFRADPICGADPSADTDRLATIYTWIGSASNGEHDGVEIV